MNKTTSLTRNRFNTRYCFTENATDRTHYFPLVFLFFGQIWVAGYDDVWYGSGR